MHVRFRPLSTWPGERTPPSHRDSSARFRASWPDTLSLLERELDHLGASEVVVEVDLTEDDIRLDGWPRAGARPRDPGVVISFTSSIHGPLRYACDTFHQGYSHQTPGYQANLRAIALGLEALRKVDRYGIASRGEQYTGWKALPTGGDVPVSAVDAACSLIMDLAGWSRGEDRPGPPDVLVRDRGFLDDVYRQAAKRVHPDAGGDPEDFRRLQEARELILSTL